MSVIMDKNGIKWVKNIKFVVKSVKCYFPVLSLLRIFRSERQSGLAPLFA